MLNKLKRWLRVKYSFYRYRLKERRRLYQDKRRTAIHNKLLKRRELLTHQIDVIDNLLIRADYKLARFYREKFKGTI